MALGEESTDKSRPALRGENKVLGFDVFGKNHLGIGVHGENGGGNSGPDRGVGVRGESKNGFGVFGSSDNHRGVRGVSTVGVGVNGINQGPSTNQPDRRCGVHRRRSGSSPYLVNQAIASGAKTPIKPIHGSFLN